MKKIIGISFLAMILLLSAFFISNSMESPVAEEAVGERLKMVGLDINRNKYVDYETAFQDALETGIDFTEITLSWDEFELEKGVYDDDLLNVINIYYPSYDLKVALTFNIIDTVDLRVPDHLNGKDLSSGVVKEEFLAYLEHVMEKLDDVEIVAVSIGNEVDGYLSGSQWQDFEDLFVSSKAIVKKHHKNAVVGSKLMYEGLENEMVESIINQSDVLMLTYYPIKDTLFIKNDTEIDSDLKAMMAYTSEKPLYLMEVGMPTSRRLASSEYRQALFIEMIFDYFSSHDHFEVMSVNWLNDRDELEMMTFVDYYGLEDEKFYEYLSTLGLRDSKGNSKEGFITFKNEMEKLNGVVDE